MRRALETILGGILIIALIAVSAYLFYPEKVGQLKNITRFNPQANTSENLHVVMSSAAVSLDPATYEATSRTVLMNVYESLVRPNKFLQIEPQLAVSWGVLDDKTTWVFKLRQNVTFHDGSALDANDVMASITHAIQHDDSQLKTLLSTITRIEKIDDKTIRIITKKPDPVLPRKISTVLIFPSGSPPQNPVGTGPYTLTKNEQGYALTHNKQYWGIEPTFSQVQLSVIPDKFERLKAFRRGDIDILLNVPADREKEIRDQGAQAISKPGLTVNYLVFNHEHPLFKEENARRSINLVINKKELSELAAGFVKPVSQYLPLGILGYNPSIETIRWNKPEAQRLMKTVPTFERGMEITLDAAEELGLFVRYLQEYFAKVGIRIKPNLISQEALAEKIAQKKSDLYFSGWRFELGDGGDFLGEVIHSRGHSNASKFANEELDRQIEESNEELDPILRARMMKEIAQRITEDETFGVPLFETRVLYAAQSHLSWEPRLDGYFLASDVHRK